MARIISVANQKGGVGKTTTVLNLGSALSKEGKRVLLVDLDPQAALSTSLGVRLVKNANTVYQFLLSQRRVSRIIRRTASGPDLIPAGLAASASAVPASGGAEARDQGIRSPLLCRLSYGPTSCPRRPSSSTFAVRSC